MSTLIIKRIKNYLDREFKSAIDLSDIEKRSSSEKEKNYLSRALAAYALTIEADASIADAGLSITDGYDDNGIDAIYFDSQSKYLWLIQSKFIHDGQGGIDNGDIEKFSKGIKNLINCDFQRFNRKVISKEKDIMEALEDPTVKIQIVLAYTGRKLSSHNIQSIQDILDEQNDTEEVLFFTDFNIDKVYKGLEIGVGAKPINEELLLSNWGHIEAPLKSYYGIVSGIDLSVLWEEYGTRLFTENIRSFLGNSPANEEIIKTIKLEPENFVYFNNGITILCNSIKKKLMGGSDKASGTFTCTNISVVNGAQTLGSIGSLAKSNPEELSKVKVLVRFISLEDSSEAFGKRITIATNTQNKVEKKDFVSLDKEQGRLKFEFRMENIDYHYKRTDEKILPDEKNYMLEESAYGLASLWENVDYSTMVKKESGKLWEDVTKAPYTDLFNQNVTAQKIIKVVKVYRYISEKMSGLANGSEGRARSIYRYGNSFVAHIIFQKMPKKIWADSYDNFEEFLISTLPDLTDKYIEYLHDIIEEEYPEAMIVYVLRNYTKCRVLKEKIMSL